MSTVQLEAITFLLAQFMQKVTILKVVTLKPINGNMYPKTALSELLLIADLLTKRGSPRSKLRYRLFSLLPKPPNLRGTSSPRAKRMVQCRDIGQFW